jgi:hypothetical protein
MPESLVDQLSRSSLKASLLQAVATEEIDQILDDFDDHARFVACAVRAVARRTEQGALCVFVYSEAPLAEGRPLKFSRVAHMQDGHGMVEGMAILTGRDANNGACRALAGNDPAKAMDEVEALGFGDRIAVIWDGTNRIATVYPNGVGGEGDHIRIHVPASDAELTQNDVCSALDIAYNDNLKNPSGRTVKLWSGGKLIATAEDEIERHIKGQLSLYFAGRKQKIRVLSQTNTSAGRTDLMFLEGRSSGGPKASGVLELKVLRGPHVADRSSTTEGLSQGYYYRKELGLPFATLALYDVSITPTEEIATLLAGQDATHIEAVRVRRFPLFGSPKAWRDAGGPVAA